MDKRKGIILAIVLFLIIGLGTFVFAGTGNDETNNNEQEPGNGTINDQQPADDGEDQDGSDPEQDDVSGNIGEGDNEESQTVFEDTDDEEESDVGEEQPDGDQGTGDSDDTEDSEDPVDEEVDYAALLGKLDALDGLFTNEEAVNVGLTAEDIAVLEGITYTLTLNGNALTDFDLNNLTEEGEYVLTINDANVSEEPITITFTSDRTYPLLTIGGEVVEPTEEVIYVNGNIEVSVDEDNLQSFTSNGHDRTENVLAGAWTITGDSGYTLVLTDKAGNKTTYKVVVDKTPIAVNHLYVKNNTHEDYNVSEENRYKVIGKGQELYVEYVLKEEFTSTPILTIGGKEYKMTCDVASWNDELYKCDAHVTISEDMNLVNGEVIPFTITGVKDIAGNETIVTEENTTVTNKYGKVVYDNDPAQSIWVYTLNADEDHRTIIGNNQKLIVEINVNEELLKNPVITIGSYQVELTRRANDSRYIYSKTITIDADKMKLIHDENIAFTISVTDVAGNTTTLDNDNVTIHEENGYDQVKYDGKAPKYKQLGVLNVDHLRNDEDVTVINLGEEIRVLFNFSEILGVNPKMTIGESKTIYELKLAEDYDNFAKYTYVADIQINEDMNLANGDLVYTIFGYADAAGNVGKTIYSTDSDIKVYSQYPGVKYDTTAGIIELNGESQIVLEAGIDEYAELGATVTDNIDGEKQLTPAYIHYSKNGDFIDEVPSVDYMKTGTYKIVYKYTDAAGNASVDANRPDHDYVIRTVIVKDETKPLLTLNGSSTIKLEYGIDEYDELGATVTDNVDETITNLTPTQIKFNGKIIDDISSVKFDQIGTYKLTYTYTDSNGNLGVSHKNPELNGVVRTVIVKDETKPLLTLNGSSTIKLEYGIDEYDELGATVTDNFDAPITNLTPTQIKFNGKIIEDISSVKFDQIGTYKLTYTYTDSNGNVGVSHKNPELNGVVRTVIVKDETKPLLKLNGDSTIRLINGKDNYIELGATVTDNFDAPITNLAPTQIKFNGKIVEDISSVKFDQIGTYKLIYTSTDSNGNVGVSHKNPELNSVVRTVIVMSENTTSLVDGVGYESLKDAVNAALSSGSTVELLNDVVSSESINITAGKELTLDLNGKIIELAGGKNFNVKGGTLTIEGSGTIKEVAPYYAPVMIHRDTDNIEINIGKDVTLEGWAGIFIDIDADPEDNPNAGKTIINFAGNINSVIDIKGAAGHGIYINGTNKNTLSYPIINIYEGANINSLGDGIYAAGYAEWNIYGGSIEAPGMAIGIKAGKLNIFGGIFKATGPNSMPTENFGNGINESGAALQIESNPTYAGAIDINISGGTFISENAAAIYEYDSTNSETRVNSFSINGGNFISNNYANNFSYNDAFLAKFPGFMTGGKFNKNTDDIEKYLATGYIIEPQADGSYKIVQG